MDIKNIEFIGILISTAVIHQVFLLKETLKKNWEIIT